MKKIWIFSGLFFLMAFLPSTSSGLDDLFSRKKSDSAIKPLVFPLSMAVIENRPMKGLYYFYEGEAEKFDESFEGNPDSSDNNFYSLLSDPTLIKKTLGATDPTRITPSKRGNDIRGPLTRMELKEISKKVSKDLIFVFRREIRMIATFPLPQSVFLQPDEFFTYKWPGPYTVKIRNQGLIYLTKQNKLMVVPSNEKSKSFFPIKETIPAEELKAGWQKLAKEGLEDLAAAARKTIRAKQFVVHRPIY